MKLPSLHLNSLRKPQESKLFLSLVPLFKEKKTQQFTTLSLTFVTIAFFGLFAIGPTFSTISDLQKQLDDNTFVNQQLQQKIANLTTLQGKYTQVEPQLDPVLAAVPQTPAIDVFVGQVHQIALQANVELNRVQTLPVDISPSVLARSTHESYAFSIEAQGNLLSLQQFIDQLSSFNRLVTFDTVEYARIDNIANIFRATIRGSTYFKPAAL